MFGITIIPTMLVRSGHYKFGLDLVLKQEYVAIYGGDENTERGQINTSSFASTLPSSSHGLNPHYQFSPYYLRSQLFHSYRHCQESFYLFHPLYHYEFLLFQLNSFSWDIEPDTPGYLEISLLLQVL